MTTKAELAGRLLEYKASHRGDLHELLTEAAAALTEAGTGEAKVADHKWFDHECQMKGCQSLVWKGRYEAAVRGRADFRQAYREARDLWRELVEKDDRTSPAEYPDMALITFDELQDFLTRASPPPVQPVVKITEAVRMMVADHMTSKKHHPGYVLVPTAAFEMAREAVGDMK